MNLRQIDIFMLILLLKRITIETVGCAGHYGYAVVFPENRTRGIDLQDVKNVNKQHQAAAIDPSILKFALALFIVAVMLEIVDRISTTAAWTLYVIIVLGLLLNNPVAIGLISLGGRSLEQGVK